MGIVGTPRLKDITGQKFGRLTVMGFSHLDKSRKSYWKCICICGNEKIVRQDGLTRGSTKSCGCLNDEKRRECLDLKSKYFGRWKVLYKSDDRNNQGDILWMCQCECGTLREVTTSKLNSDTSKSCGCLNKEILSSHSGKNSVHWKGGITPLCISIRECFLYDKWRKEVFVRDDYTCQSCNIRGGALCVHHKIPFSVIINKNNIKKLKEAIDCSILWDINNGTTLCTNCHTNAHKENVVRIYNKIA